MMPSKSTTQQPPTAESSRSRPASRRLDDVASEPRLGLAGEFWFFLTENKKWWLAPILLVLGVLALLAIFAGSGAAPFIYSFG